MSAIPGLDDSTLTRALYSSDASLYRVVPTGVARPRSVAELGEVVDAARAADLPLTCRGAGTSCAGNAVGSGVVVDLRGLNRILAVDPDDRTARVEPGVVQEALQRAAAEYGLRFGPDPSTSSRCTIGGMIGNNACGPRALGYGRTADNVVALEVITGTGERLIVDSRTDLRTSGSPTLRALREVVAANLGVIRTEFGRFSRQVSGYSLEHLLPERGFDVAKFLVGTEGTLAVVTSASVRLVADPPERALVVLGYPSMADAADAVPALLPFGPTAAEGLDRRLVDVVVRKLGAAAVPNLPAGDGWSIVELAGDDPAEVEARARALVVASGALDAIVLADPLQAAALWRIRADGAGLAAVGLDRPAHAGWEDAAVPPERLGDYLRDFEALLAAHGLDALPYGHFGEGCVHARIDFDLTTADATVRYRAFIEAAADLVAAHGGSMSGEHGDGRARSELLPRMYSPAALAVFAQVKAVFDPGNRLNPGVVVDPRPLAADLRIPALRGRPLVVADPRFAAEVHRCTGVGKCLAASGGVMCPSFRATRNEQDSTRGRARVLQEMVSGRLITAGWRSPEVAEALELCLACKGCAHDCPTGVDIASYKSRVLSESYRGRVRPRSHYALGWLPTWARLISKLRVAGLVNAALGLEPVARVAKWLAGVDPRRSLPRFYPAPRRGDDTASAGGTPVAVWVDSFTASFAPQTLTAVLKVLTEAGYRPTPIWGACCGLTWISTGQLDVAARHLSNALDLLHPLAASGVPIVGIEPSCLAVWRSDAAELLEDARVRQVAAATRTLAELLAETPSWKPPDLSSQRLVVQPHCHHAAVIGWDADAALLASTGAEVTVVAGCCGLAGNFGVEQGHYDVSVAVAEHDLLPAVHSAGAGSILVADGFSCRTQLDDLADREAITLAQLLAAGVARRPQGLA